MSFNTGDKARIIVMPSHGRHLLGATVRVVAIGGYGYEADDVMVRTDDGLMFPVKEHQLAKTEK